MHVYVRVCMGRFERERKSTLPVLGLGSEVNYIFWLAES